MKILIADKFEQVGIDELKKVTKDVACEPGIKDDVLVKRVREFDPTILIVRSTKVPAAVMDAGKQLKVIIRAGAGYDTIDVPAATKHGIKVSNCPGKNSVAVAELVMGLMLALDRRIPDNVADLRAHKWNKKEFSKARGLKGSTLGLVGAGQIGREVARRALAFDMNVLFYDVIPNIKLVDSPNCKQVELERVLREADVISVHVPGGDSTRNLINAERIGMMKRNVLFINTSRATVVDEAALVAALKEKRIRGAALDVYANEPPAEGTTFTGPVADLPNLYGTHHIGASTEQAQLAVAEETVRIVKEFEGNGKVLNCVNP